MKQTVIYVHGKGGSADEAAHYQPLFPDAEVVGFDYRAQTPWEAKAEFPAFFAAQRERCDRLTLIANSIGAFFALSSLDETLVDRAYLISPVVDMEQLIGDMLRWANASEQELAARAEIPTAFGETLSWQYLCYVREHPIAWHVPTAILYGERDHLTSFATISAFAGRHRAKLCVMPGGEHWFHTPEQLHFLDGWLRAAEARTPVVRRAERADLPRVNALRKMVSELHAAGRPGIFRPGFCDELRQRAEALLDAPQSAVIVAELAGSVCGFAILQYVDRPESAYQCARRFCHIEEFGVDEACRRSGVGTALLTFCKAEAKRRGFARLTLDVWAFNADAQKFYEAVGFHTYRSDLELSI